MNGKVNPKSDIEVINLELVFSDLDQVLLIIACSTCAFWHKISSYLIKLTKIICGQYHVEFDLNFFFPGITMIWLVPAKMYIHSLLIWYTSLLYTSCFFGFFSLFPLGNIIRLHDFTVMIIQFAYRAGDLQDSSIFVELELILAYKWSCLCFDISY